MKVIDVPQNFILNLTRLPSIEMIPQIVQLIMDKPTLPDPLATPFGEIKIPEPKPNSICYSDQYFKNCKIIILYSMVTDLFYTLALLSLDK